MSGRLFQKSEHKAEHISAKIAPKVQQEIINKLLYKYPDLEVLTLGSVSKRNDDEFNGDIDIAVKAEKLEDLYKIISDVFDYTETVENKSIYIISMNYPYEYDDETKYVAVDFIQMHNTEYTKFRYYCPDYRKNESRYKVGTKIMFIGTILNHCDMPQVPDYVGQYCFDATHLYINYFNKTTKKWYDEFVTYDPLEVLHIMFDSDDLSICNSVETIWDAIHSDKFKYPDRVKDIEIAFFVNSYRKGWEELVKPEDFDIQYWTLDEIKEKLKMHTLLRKINILLSNIQ